MRAGDVPRGLFVAPNECSAQVRNDVDESEEATSSEPRFSSVLNRFRESCAITAERFNKKNS